MYARVCYSWSSNPKFKRSKMPKLETDEKKDLQGIAKKFVCTNFGFVYDLYLMLKSGGKTLMAWEKAKRAIPKMREKFGVDYTTAYKVLNKQHTFFTRLKIGRAHV